VVALAKPSDAERGQWYLQRYIENLPTKGEIIFFERSWYNRSGVEHVMGFCSPREYLEFMRQAPEFERMMVRSGIRLFKFWFSVSREEQLRRFLGPGRQESRPASRHAARAPFHSLCRKRHRRGQAARSARCRLG
jgi:polyphosphate kinase 2 (PPK2 family)